MSDEPHAAPAAGAQDPAAGHGGGHSGSFAGLALAALGVVYGDIGTSPLYAIKECFHGPHAVDPNPTNVLGVLSLVFWSLTIVVSLKYLAFIMRADNHGEGGIFALLALVPPAGERVKARLKAGIILVALMSAALLYGDGIITPAISVLSAVEGLTVATDKAGPFVVPATCLILVALFSVQRHGTARVGRVFGPIMLVWFATLAALGVRQIVDNPSVLMALSPHYAARFFAENHIHGIVVLGSVVLCITGGEALYADLGHFGRRPIRISWFGLVFPALLLNYFGQGAYLLAHLADSSNPFFNIVPETMLYPMVGLATAATVIASQALISGAFSLTRQAVQLGYLPRIHIVHTSGQTEGQIYIPFVNWAMMLACLALVLAFRASSNLAAAYGIAVTADMVITSCMYFFVTYLTWRWSFWKAASIVALFLIFDLAYFGANLLKFFDGGWLPVVVALALLAIMTTWKTGRGILAREFEERSLPFEMFIDDVARRQPQRVSGTAVFMTSSARGTSPVLLHHLKHNKVLHQQVVILSIQSEHVPTVPAERRVSVENLGLGFFRVIARYGFMETPNVPEVMIQAQAQGLMTEVMDTSYYLGRETLLARGKGRMWRWRKALFSVVARNAQPATAYFGLPPGRVIELGMQIDL